MSVFERAARNGLSRLVGVLLPSPKKSPAWVKNELLKKASPKILLIRPQQGLGDLLLATPLLRGLQTQFPSAKLHFLADGYNKLALETNPRLSRLWVWNKKAMRNPTALLKFIGALRRERYDLAIVVTSNIPSFTSFLLAKASGARIVWAYSTLPFYSGAVWSRWLANVEIQPPREDTPEFDKFLGLLAPLGVRTGFETEFALLPEDRGAAQVAWSAIPGPGLRIGFFLAGNPDRPDRLWPAPSWAKLALRVEREFGAALIAITSPPKLRSGSGAPEPGFYEEVARTLPFTLPRFSDPSLRVVAAFLQGLTLFVTADGGVFHVATAARVPTVGLFFASDPNKWVPPVPWVSTVWTRGEPASLSPEAVLAHIRERLHAGPRPIVGRNI